MVFAIASRSCTERHGDFSESVVFHGVLLGFVGCSVVVVLCFACLVCLCLMVTPGYLSHLFSHMGELSIETKRLDDRQSFKRVRHQQKKKAMISMSEAQVVLPDAKMPCTLREALPPCLKWRPARVRGNGRHVAKRASMKLQGSRGGDRFLAFESG